MKLSAMFIIFIMAASAFLIGETPGFGSGAGTDSERFEIVGTIDEISHFSTYFTQMREVVVWDEGILYHSYVSHNETGAMAVFLRRSYDNGTTWDDPFKLWDWTNCYRMASNIQILGTDIMVFVKVANTSGWTTWSLHCVKFPAAEYGNSSSVNIVRIDDEVQGFMSLWVPVEYEGRIFLFWVQSHFMKIYYRIYDNGTWGTTRSMETGTYMSNFAPIVTDVTGTEVLYLMYQYYPDGKIYATTTDDGYNWSPVQTIMYLEEGAARLDLVSADGRIHLAFNERFGTDVYYSSSNDGFNWSSLLKLGSDFFDASQPYNYSIPFPDITIASSQNSDSLLVAFDSDNGIEIMESCDGGDTFSDVAILNNSLYPHMDPDGKILLHMDEEDTLYIRTIGDRRSNVTDPEGNDTNEDDEDNEKDDPKAPDNDTDDDQGGDVPGNGTDDKPDIPWSGDDEEEGPIEDEEEMTEDPVEDKTILWNDIGEIDADEKSANGGGWVYTLKAPVKDGVILNYTWTKNGDVIGFGSEISLHLGPGAHEIVLVMTDSDGKTIQRRIILDVPGIPSSSGWDMLPIMAISLVVIILLTGALSMFFMKRKAPKEKEDVDHIREDRAPEVVSGRLMDFDVLERYSLDKGFDDDAPARIASLRSKAEREYRSGHVDEKTYYSIREMLRSGQE